MDTTLSSKTSKLRQRVALAAAFLLGACFSTSSQSVAGEKDAPKKSTKTDAKGADGKADAKAPDAKAPAPAITTAGGPFVRALADVEHRQVPGKADVWLLARGENAFLGKLELAAGGGVPEHRDATEEYLYVVEGGGTISIDDKEYPVAAGTSIYMPANAKVSYKNGDQKLVAIQVFAGPEPVAKYDGWKPAASGG